MRRVPFPVGAYANFMKETTLRRITTDDAVIAGYIALVDTVCRCVPLIHSQRNLVSSDFIPFLRVSTFARHTTVFLA
jgi:hypothetical protein